MISKCHDWLMNGWTENAKLCRGQVERSLVLLLL